jgi:hypothetical protein
MLVAVIERGTFGGTCVNTGCIPTKTLVAGAYAAHMARCAADFRVRLEGSVRVDMPRVKARKDEISESSRRGVEQSLRTLKNCTVYRGHARFIAPHDVQVGEPSFGTAARPPTLMKIRSALRCPNFQGKELRRDQPVRSRALKFAVTLVIEEDWRRPLLRSENRRSWTRTVRWRLSEDRPPGEHIASSLSYSYARAIGLRFQGLVRSKRGGKHICADCRAVGSS